jgi:hypothetical protein
MYSNMFIHIIEHVLYINNDMMHKNLIKLSKHISK